MKNIYKKINKNNKNINQTIPKENIKTIINKVKTNNLTINKADKGNIITIQDKDELKHKILQFLNNPNYHVIKTDPTNRYQKEVKNTIKQFKRIFNDSHRYLINPNLSVSK